MLESIQDVLMSRDRMSQDEAAEAVQAAKEDINELLAEDGSLGEAEQIVADRLGLEPDYLMELLPPCFA